MFPPETISKIDPFMNLSSNLERAKTVKKWLTENNNLRILMMPGQILALNHSQSLKRSKD